MHILNHAVRSGCEPRYTVKAREFAHGRDSVSRLDISTKGKVPMPKSTPSGRSILPRPFQ